MQSVVNLSIRYGIITPYTSYLIEEDDIFSQTGRQGIVDEAVLEGAAVEVTRVVTEMVEEAADSAEMSEAEAPMALPTMVPAPAGGAEVPGETAVSVNEVVRLVGSKTFVLRNGLWIDTAYDADTMTPQKVGFASDAYFDLIAAAPELGDYLALGQRVLVVYGGQVYEVVEDAGQVDVVLPEVGAETAETTVNASPTPANLGMDVLPLPETAENGGTNWLLYSLGGLGLLIVLLIGGRLVLRK